MFLDITFSTKVSLKTVIFLYIDGLGASFLNCSNGISTDSFVYSIYNIIAILPFDHYL